MNRYYVAAIAASSAVVGVLAGDLYTTTKMNKLQKENFASGFAHGTVVERAKQGRYNNYEEAMMHVEFEKIAWLETQ